MKKVAITGGIGSGKSFVAGIMRTMGVPVYFSDIMARRLMESDAELVAALKRELSDDIYDAEGKLDRKRLASMLFSSEDIRKKVESLVHPAVVRDYLKWNERYADWRFTVFESAILFESGLNEMFDVIIGVQAPLELRIQRCLMRDGETREKVERRMAAQMPQERLSELCDAMIVNDGAINIHERLLEIFENI
ncbi:MAG: dephospho-CoA kinase [Bacteroidaceae bacterium]|nr:dephospho-CoA kinase [Bacteroidaceae bacterium]